MTIATGINTFIPVLVYTCGVQLWLEVNPVWSDITCGMVEDKEPDHISGVTKYLGWGILAKLT